MQPTTHAAPVTTAVQITGSEYSAIQRAYDYFNEKLWNGQLPQVLVTLQRHPGARGYFAPQRFNGRSKAAGTVHEIALNPDTFDDQSDADILSTLVHEMAHLWQQTFGTPPRRCYHDKEFSREMKRVGLQCSDTGLPGGKETGQKMTHYIIHGGAFDVAVKALIASGFKLNYQSSPLWGAAAKKKAKSKTKYTCAACGTNAWAKPDVKLICGECFDEDEEPTYMEAETSDEEEG